MNLPRPLPNPIRILLLGEHMIVRAALRALIESRPSLRVVGEAPNQETALNCSFEKVDLILLDLDLELEQSLHYLSRLCANAGSARVLILTGSSDSEAHSSAVRLGAAGVINKERPADVLLKAIEKVCAGEIWLDRASIARVIGGISRPDQQKPADPEAEKIASLSEREREVIAVISEGLKNRQIAERLFISEATVRHHLSSIFAKLGVSDRFELLIYAYRNKLARPPI